MSIHTEPVSLPRTQDSGAMSVHGAASPAARQTPGTPPGTPPATQQAPAQQAPATHRSLDSLAVRPHGTPATQAAAQQADGEQADGEQAANGAANSAARPLEANPAANAATNTAANSTIRPAGTPPAANSAAHPQAANPATNAGANPGSNATANSAADSRINSAASSPANPVTDSLAADSLTSGAIQGDSLPFFSPETFVRPADADSPWRDAPAETVFGTASVPAQPSPLQGMQAPSLTGNPVFQSFVLLLAVTYAMLLYRNLGDMRLLLTRVSRDRATGERLTEDPGGSGFSRFLNIATTIGMLFVGVMTVKYGDSLMPDYLIETLPQGAVLALCLLSTLAFAGVAVFQLAAVRLAGAVTLTQPFVSQLVLLKRTYFTLGVIVTSPFLLLFALCPRGTGSAWFCIIVIGLLATVILYLKEVLNLFISKKVSILHWFLYLCIVEIFPFSLLWLLAAR